MTEREALKLALSTLDEVRCETFRLLRNGQKLYAENKVWDTIFAIKQVLAQPEQEPVAWMRHDGKRVTTAEDRKDYPDYETRYSIPLYTSPPPRKPLTEEEIQKLLSQNRFAVFALVRAIEAAHGIKEKNT